MKLWRRPIFVLDSFMLRIVGVSFAIEDLTSQADFVLGKMDHSERTVGIGGFNPDFIKNIACNKEASSCQNLFRAGVRYFG